MTTAGTAEGAGERGFHSNIDGLQVEDGCKSPPPPPPPRDGILKTVQVEVDIESGRDVKEYAQQLGCVI